jgi:hypothetical protein
MTAAMLAKLNFGQIDDEEKVAAIPGIIGTTTTNKISVIFMPLKLDRLFTAYGENVTFFLICLIDVRLAGESNQLLFLAIDVLFTKANRLSPWHHRPVDFCVMTAL